MSFDDELTLSEREMARAVELITGMEYGLLPKSSRLIRNPDGSTLAVMNEAGARKAIQFVLQAVNEATEPNRTFRRLRDDLERLSTSGLPSADQARDLLLSYEIRRRDESE
ncbi:hypothetical protein SEA_AKHILA_85 [Mycobacterium phage Akhila]|nr:hypothetical protein SEA_AKHILA_85 [Mycobacterium phage Akhila]UAJ16686.1 hypothetical protein SEA_MILANABONITA_84 [Mycobacterium phage MilanaBonita]